MLKPALAVLLLLSSLASAQGEELPVMPQPDLEDESPPVDPTCAALARVIDAAPGKFESLRGKPGKGTSVWASSIVIPDMSVCVVTGPLEPSSSAVVACRMPLKGEPNDKGVYQRLVEKVAGCLGKEHWTASPGIPKTELRSDDPRAPQIDLLWRTKGLLARDNVNAIDLTVSAAPPARVVDPAAFCDSVRPFINLAAADFEGMRVDKNPLLGTSSCTHFVSAGSKPLVQCVIYEGNDERIATSSYRYFAQSVARCIPMDQWKVQAKGLSAVFEHPSPAAPVITVLHARDHVATAEQRKTLGISPEQVTVSFQLRPSR